MSELEKLFDDFKSGFKSGGGNIGDVAWAVSLPVLLPILLVGGAGVLIADAFVDHDARRIKEDREETRNLWQAAKAAIEATPIETIPPDEIRDALIREAVFRSEPLDRDLVPSTSVIQKFYNITDYLMADEGLFGLPDVNWEEPLDLKQGVLLRNYLRKQVRFFGDFKHYFELWSERVMTAFAAIINHLPESAFLDDEEEQTHQFSVPLVDCVEQPAELIELISIVFFEKEVVKANLFEGIREQLDANALRASGIDPEDRYRTKKSLVFPTDTRGIAPDELAERYLSGTPFHALLLLDLPFSIPTAVRFEHCHIVGGTGHGKTQCLQSLIHSDLEKARDDQVSVVVIDSQGDLIRTISHLSYFSPHVEKNLADKFMLIDPNDIEHPVCLNMFDVNMERIKSYSALEREKVLNGTIELYEYIFGALLGAELTQKQGVIFRYLARLMLHIPNATIQTLRQLMEDGRPFMPCMDALQGTSRDFFGTQFFDRSFAGTKTQILRRLWGVLSNSTFERMFSNPTNKVDMFDAMNQGKIILINTAKDLLKQEGCEIFGRFFIAMIAQAALQRSVIEPDKRMHTFVYVDEAQDYFDDNIGHILNQARKYRVGLTLAHQNLNQLSASLQATIMASTSVKLAGGVSAKDATAFSKEMHCDPDFIQGMRKRAGESEFACWIKNTTPRAIKIAIPLGAVDRLPTITDAVYEQLIEENRRRYCGTFDEFAVPEPPPLPETIPIPEQVVKPEAVPPPIAEEAPQREPVVEAQPTPELQKDRPAKPRPAPPDIPRPLGKGGREHKHLQHLLKQFAQEQGFRATIEEQILDGEGSVDLSLERDGLRIACEISVSTSPEHELGNVEKCLVADYDQVIVVSKKARHLQAVRKFVIDNLTSDACEQVFFFSPEACVDHLTSIAEDTASEQKIRGYTVSVKRTPLDEADMQRRRQALVDVVSRSLREPTGER